MSVEGKSARSVYRQFEIHWDTKTSTASSVTLNAVSSDDLKLLAASIQRRNEADAAIARIIGRPAEKGHIGEFIASRIFGIELSESAVQKGEDGHSRRGPLQGKSVNIKFYGKQEGSLDVRPNALPDYFLVLTGAKSAAASSRGLTRPLVIEAVYLFDATELVRILSGRPVKFSVATSVAQAYWQDAELYPAARYSLLSITGEQRRLLGLFGGI